MDERPVDLSQYRLVKLPLRRSVTDTALRPVPPPPSFADRSADADIDGKILAWIRSHVGNKNSGKLH